MQILITSTFAPALVERIHAVDPSVRTVSLSPAEGALLRGVAPADRGSEAEARESLLAKLPETEVLLGWPDVTDEMLARAPKLAWAHATAAGVDPWLTNAIFRDSRITITNSSGAGATVIGEYILSSMLALSFQLPRYLRQQAEHHWERHRPSELAGQTLGIVGLGAIGAEAARRARAFEMRILALRRSPAGRAEDGLADRLLPPSGLPDLLAESDFVALTLPLTAETHGLIGEPELRRMKPSASLINVSRGAIIEEQALIRALNEGWIAGAALDVFEQEPLPASSPLWDLERAILTPHVSGSSVRHRERSVAIFCDNLRRYLAGEPLQNVVDRGRGY